MDIGVKQSIQFPDEDDLDDCPDVETDTTSDQVPEVPRGINNVVATAVIANGHAECGNSLGSSKVARDSGRKGQGLICSEDEESSSGEDDDDDDEVASGLNAGCGTAGNAGDTWKLEDGESITCECFICNHTTKGYEAADLMKTHVESFHDLSFAKLRTTFKLDFPGFVQFVRWARELKSLGTVEKTLAGLWSLPNSCPGDLPWSADKYLLPPSEESTDSQLPVDYFLTLDFFATEEKPLEEGNGGIVLNDLVSEIERLQLDKERMTAVFQRIVAGNMDEDRAKQSPFSHNSNVSPSKRSGKKWSPRTCSVVEDDSSNHNKLYFESYDELSIHHDMIFDHSRTEAYRDAIIDRAEDIKGKVVMDLGCGSGILSMFCAQQGAKIVHAIDKSNIIFDAMSNSFENNFDKVIRFHHKDLDNDDTSDLEREGQVDVLVSEFMGYFLFFEGMTESFIRARKKYLKPDGILMPDSCTIELAPIGPSGIYRHRVECWNQVYGFKMPAMKQRAVKEPLIDLVKSDDIIGNRVPVKLLDLRTCNVSDVYIDAEFEFEFNADTEFCAVAGYFSVDFTGPKRTITLSTSPWNTPTHWKQTVFFFPNPIKVAKGEKLSGSIRSCNHKDDPRWLIVLLTFGDKKFFYEIK